MSVTSVSFGNSQVFQDLINKPQSYTTQTPSATTNIAGEEKPKKGTKIGVGLVVTAVALAAALGYAAKTGKFDKLVEATKDNNIFSKIVNGAKTAGEWIANKATSLKDKLFKFKEGSKKATETIQDNAEKAIETVKIRTDFGYDVEKKNWVKSFANMKITDPLIKF